MAARLASPDGTEEKRNNTLTRSSSMSVAYRSCSPRTPGTEWVALSEATAAIVRSIPVPQHTCVSLSREKRQ
jgi:hypothetical protein